MESREILLLKTAEDVRASAMSGDEERCKQKLSEMESYLDNFGREEDRNEVQNYIDNIELGDISDVLPELVHFTDTIVGKFIGQNFSNLTPADTIIIEESDINMKGLFEKGGIGIIDENDVLDTNPDQVIQESIISRFNLDLNTEDIDHGLKILLSYLSLEYKAVLEHISDDLSDLKSELSDKVEERHERLDRLNEDLDDSGDMLQEILEKDHPDPPDRPPRVQEMLEDSNDDDTTDRSDEALENLKDEEQETG